MRKIFLFILLLVIIQNAQLFAQPYYIWNKRDVPTSNNLNFIGQGSAGLFIFGNNGVIISKAPNTSLWILRNSGTTANLNNCLFFGSSLFACGSSGVIIKSTDNGLNWSLINSGTSANLKSILRYSSTVFSAFGDNGVYVQSTNGGTNWNVKAPFTNQNLTYGVNTGGSSFVCGSSGVIFKSTDFSTTWQNVSLASTVNLTSIAFRDANTGFVTGENGYLAMTTNAGATWVQQTTNVTPKLNNINLASPFSYVVGNSGTIIKTSNIGVNWLSENTFTNINLNSVFFNGENGFAAGEDGNVFERHLDSTFIYNSVLNYNYLLSYFTDKLLLNRNVTTDQDGLEWPRGTGKFISYALGMNISAKVNGLLRTATAFEKSEFSPGYAQNGNYLFDSRFKIYKVRENDPVTSYAWQKWGDVVPFGAPYDDRNMNGIYEPLIDKPGVKSAGETNFICVTDAADSSHHVSNGYGAGTLPLGAEVHFTFWSDHFMVDTASLHITDNAIFMKYEIINKSNNVWTGTYFSFLNEGYIGNINDDYIGCDPSRELAYYYNSDDIDGTGGPKEYGQNPPAYGCAFLKGAFLNSSPTVDLGLTSMGYFYGTTGCSSNNMTSDELYNMARGFKKDGTPWVNIVNNQTTKYNYSGDPETGIGWTEYNGRILNCGGSTTGPTEIPSTPANRNIIFSTGDDNLTMNPGDKQVIILTQAVARGSNNKNAVTKLKYYIDTINVRYYIPRVSVNIQPITSVVPENFSLYQNYPNPFNPSTEIKFDINLSGFVSIAVYDITGKEVRKLVNENLSAGTYELQYDAGNLPSGIYFYSLNTASFSQTKKMILVK